MTTWNDVKTRATAMLTAMGTAAVGTVLTGAEEYLSSLPAVEVRLGTDITRTRPSAFSLTVTRDVFFVQYVQQIVDPMKKADVDSAWDACEAYVDTIPDWFLDYPRLEYGGTPIIAASGPMTSGVRTEPVGTKAYAAVFHRLPVTINKL